MLLCNVQFSIIIYQQLIFLLVIGVHTFRSSKLSIGIIKLLFYADDLREKKASWRRNKVPLTKAMIGDPTDRFPASVAHGPRSGRLWPIGANINLCTATQTHCRSHGSLHRTLIKSSYTLCSVSY